jgi:zinc protease
MMMGEGNNSVFYKNFVKTEKAIEASTSHGSNELAGEFQIVVVTYPEYEFTENDQGLDKDQIKQKMREMVMKSFNETEKRIHETIDTFGVAGITDEALARVKARVGSDIVDRTSSVLGKASSLATGACMSANHTTSMMSLTVITR